MHVRRALGLEPGIFDLFLFLNCGLHGLDVFHHLFEILSLSERLISRNECSLNLINKLIDTLCGGELVGITIITETR